MKKSIILGMVSITLGTEFIGTSMRTIFSCLVPIFFLGAIIIATIMMYCDNHKWYFLIILVVKILIMIAYILPFISLLIGN